MNTDKKAKLIEAFALGCSWREASTQCGVSTATIWRWCQADPAFHQSIKDACAGPDQEVEAVTYLNAIDPDPAHNTLRMFWLKSRMPEKYSDKLQIEHSGEITLDWGDSQQSDDAAPALGAAGRQDSPGAIQGAGVRQALGQDETGCGPVP